MSTISRPNGVRETGISLKFAKPRGMSMIVRHMSTPVMTCPRASHHPASTNQMMLPISEPAPAYQRAPEGPEAEESDPRARDPERDRDDQNEHDECHDGIAQCQD